MKRTYLIDRRQVLRGTGAALALPLLDIMAPAVGAKPAVVSNAIRHSL